MNNTKKYILKDKDGKVILPYTDISMVEGADDLLQAAKDYCDTAIAGVSGGAKLQLYRGRGNNL